MEGGNDVPPALVGASWAHVLNTLFGNFLSSAICRDAGGAQPLAKQERGGLHIGFV